jgi:hypothetical protein
MVVITFVILHTGVRENSAECPELLSMSTDAKQDSRAILFLVLSLRIFKRHESSHGDCAHTQGDVMSNETMHLDLCWKKFCLWLDILSVSAIYWKPYCGFWLVHHLWLWQRFAMSQLRTHWPRWVIEYLCTCQRPVLEGNEEAKSYKSFEILCNTMFAVLYLFSYFVLKLLWYILFWLNGNAKWLSSFCPSQIMELECRICPCRSSSSHTVTWKYKTSSSSQNWTWNP